MKTFIQALNLVNKELWVIESFYAVILGSDQGRDMYIQKKLKDWLNSID